MTAAARSGPPRGDGVISVRLQRPAPPPTPGCDADPTRDPSGGHGDPAGGWRPTRWVGAPATGGLALPAARPSASHCYAPRGVCLDGERLIVADTGNHRVLIWHGVPEADHADADVVLGQPDFAGEGPAAGGRGPEAGLHLPTGVVVHDGRLLVADAWHHRILVWDAVPERNDQPPDIVLGQPDAATTEPNAGRGCDAATFYWPFGLAVVDGDLWVADTGNRRVLGWRGVPDPGTPADVVLGQPDATARGENRDGPVAADSFRWPHDIAGDGRRLWVADAGNHRVLAWAPPPTGDGPARIALGQPDLRTGREFPYAPQHAGGLRFPYAVAADGDHLAVADTANNRILWWEAPPERSGEAAVAVLGQPDLTRNGENRWEQVDAASLCWPYGLALQGRRLAIADSGNNRVVLWERP